MLDTEDRTTTLEEHRQAFPGLHHKVYFNFGGQGPLPQAAIEAIIDAHNYLQLKGPFSLKINAWLQKRNALLRSDLATELQVNPKTLTLTENVTAGCNIVLWGFPWQAGDHILLTDCEHPGIMAIVREVAKRFNLVIDYAPIRDTLNQGNPVEVIAQSLEAKTRLVVLSHILWNTGQLLPLSEIVELCHSYQAGNVQVLVDAAQSVGVLPLNLTELKADFYAFTGHKWLCGPAGVGGLYIRPEVFTTLRPTFLGWRGIYEDETDGEFRLREDGQRFEIATSAYPQYEGLRAALAIHQEWATPIDRYNQICDLSGYLWQKLSNLAEVECLKKSPPQAGLVSFTVQSKLSHAEIVQALETQGFFLRTLKDPDCLRACVHYFTIPTEIDRLIESLQGIIEGK